MTRLLFAAALVAFAPPVAVAAPPAVDVADLFPPGALAFAELHAPAELGPQLAAVFKGTPLEDSIPFIENGKAQAKTLPEAQAKRDLARLALFASPEMLAEFRKFGGVAAGVVGFGPNGEPELALAVLTGDSAAGIAARMFITSDASFRKVAEVSKVPVFQSRPPVVSYDPAGRPTLDNSKPPAEAPFGPDLRLHAGAVRCGNEQVRDQPAHQAVPGRGEVEPARNGRVQGGRGRVPQAGVILLRRRAATERQARRGRACPRCRVRVRPTGVAEADRQPEGGQGRRRVRAVPRRRPVADRVGRPRPGAEVAAGGPLVRAAGEGLVPVSRAQAGGDDVRAQPAGEGPAPRGSSSSSTRSPSPAANSAACRPTSSRTCRPTTKFRSPTCSRK